MTEQTSDQTQTKPEPEVSETETEPTSNREAKYRRALRETETERDTLREQVTTMQRDQAERIAADQLAKPAGLWASGTVLADLLDDTGHIDPAKVTEAAQSAADALGLAQPTRSPRPDLTQGGRGAVGGPADDWADAFAPQREH